jgi:hypothetical protein
MSAYRNALSVALRGASRESYLASLQAFLDANLIRSFKAYEVCNVGRRTYDSARKVWVELQPAPVELWDNILPTLHVLEWVRAQYGVPVDVSSGYRDPAYNRAVGGAGESVHADFCAVDFLPRGQNPRAVGLKILREFPDAKLLGIGVYNSFVHVDARHQVGLSKGTSRPALFGGIAGWWK